MGSGTRTTVVTLAIVGLVSLGLVLLTSQGPDSVIVDVAIPELSDMAQDGAVAFNRNCAGCHGVNAAGSDDGPSLIQAIYEPGHHADAAFYLAVNRGVSAHHWRFGNMPPQPEVSETEVQQIVQYIRELQQANRI